MQSGHQYTAAESPAIPQYTGEVSNTAPPQQQVESNIVYGQPAYYPPPSSAQSAAQMSADEAYARQLQAQEGQPPSGGGDPMKAPPMQYGQPQPIPGGAAPYFNPQQPMQYGAPPPNGVFQGQPIAMGVPMNAPPSGQPMYYGAPLMQAVPIQSQYGVPPGGQPYPMRPAAFGGAYGGAYSSGPRPQLVVGQRGWLPPGFWSDGVCDCSGDCGSCCAACWVPPYRWAKTISQLNLMGFGAACVVYFVPWLLTIIAYILSTSSDLGWFLWIAILSHVTLVILSCVFRGRIRYTYQIAGDSCEDCCMSCCCTCCAVAQEGRHVDRDHGLLAPVVVYR